MSKKRERNQIKIYTKKLLKIYFQKCQAISKSWLKNIFTLIFLMQFFCRNLVQIKTTEMC